MGRHKVAPDWPWCSPAWQRESGFYLLHCPTAVDRCCRQCRTLREDNRLPTHARVTDAARKYDAPNLERYFCGCAPRQKAARRSNRGGAWEVTGCSRALMDQAKPDVPAYMSFPPQHCTKLHSTNPLER